MEGSTSLPPCPPVVRLRFYGCRQSLRGCPRKGPCCGLPPPRAIQMRRPPIVLTSCVQLAGGCAEQRAWRRRATSSPVSWQQQMPSVRQQAGRLHLRATGHPSPLLRRQKRSRRHLHLGVTAMICDEHAARRPGLPAALLGSASAAALGRPDRRRPVVQPMGPADNGAMLIVTAWTGAHLLHPQ